MPTILPEKNSCLVLTQDNVLEEFRKAGILACFQDGTKLADLDMGDFSVPTILVRLDKYTNATEISTILESVKLSSAGLLSLARKLIETPHYINHEFLCIQNEKADSQGNFVRAVAQLCFDQRMLVVYRHSVVWSGCAVFLVHLQA